MSDQSIFNLKYYVLTIEKKLNYGLVDIHIYMLCPI